MADNNHQVTCVSCQTAYNASSSDLSFIPPSTYMCRECVLHGLIPRFHLALKYEHAYPVDVGGPAPAHPRQFSADLSQDFIRRFSRKAAEYHTPVRDRVYCTASIKEADHVEGAALRGEGAIALTEGEVEAAREAGEAVRVCGAMVCDGSARVGSVVCYYCGDVKVVAAREGGAADGEEEGRAFDGLVRGRDYQFCPNPDCSIRTALREACNHLTCGRCETHFCVVCGEGTYPEEGTRHWNPHFGTCPLYGQPGEQHPPGPPLNLRPFVPFLAALPGFAVGVLPAEMRDAVEGEQVRQREAANQLAYQVNAVIVREDEHRLGFVVEPADDAALQALQWPDDLRQRRAAGARQGDAGGEPWEDLVIEIPQRHLQDMLEDAAPAPPAPVRYGNEIVEQVVDLPEPEELPGDVVPPPPPMRPDALRTRRLRALARRAPLHGLQEELVVPVFEEPQAADGREDEDEAEDTEAPPPPPEQPDEEWVHAPAEELARIHSRRALEHAVGVVHRRLGPIDDRAPSPQPIEPEENWEPAEEGQDEPEDASFELEDLSDSDSVRQQPYEVWEPDDVDRELQEGRQGDLFELWREVETAHRDFEQGNFPPSPPSAREIEAFDQMIAEMREREALGLPALPQGETDEEERRELVQGVEARVAELPEGDPERGFRRMVLRGMLRRRGL